MITEKPPHTPFMFSSKRQSHENLRCFYIDGVCQFAFFVDNDDIDTILKKFTRNKDFLSMKEYLSPEWDHISLIHYHQQTNEVFLSTDKKYKNILDSEVSLKTLYAEAQKKLKEERIEKEEADNKKYLEDLEKQRITKEEKQRKHSEKMLRKAKKESVSTNKIKSLI